MINALKYLWTLIKHKWFVFEAGRYTGANLWDLLVHDLSKFRWGTLHIYGDRWYGSGVDTAEFLCCRTQHHFNSKHHFEYWCQFDIPLPMLERYIREMIADWCAAYRLTEGCWPSVEKWPWLDENWRAILNGVHPKTANKIAMIMAELMSQGEW